MATNGTTNGARKDNEKPAVFLFTWPRTASHLTEKILSLQPGVKLTTHPMMRPVEGYVDSSREQEMLLSKSAMGKATDADRERLKTLYQIGYDRMWSDIDNIHAEGKRPLIHEHITYTVDPAIIIASIRGKLDENNLPKAEEYWTYRRTGETPGPRTGPLLYPDSWITDNAYTVIPVRHPAAGFPSILRTLKVSEFADVQESPVVLKLLTLNGVVRAVKFLEARAPADKKPIILDVDDIMVEGEKREKMMEKFYKRIEFEHPPQWTWETQDEMEATGRTGTWKESINKSTGIVAGKTAKNLNVDQLYPKWVEEFGQKSADFLRERVAAEIPNYEYLATLKMTPDS